ncbi:MAG: GNAT family N-acetyltransferase [Gammaproteobacteria bacterium]|nr:GNAT family N-acetyltransferase [Gammaproteobacteria bacterium]
MSQLEFVDFRPEMVDELISMWRRSFNRALAPYRDPHSFEEHREFLLEVLRKRAVLTVAQHRETIVGFMAQAGEKIEQLYLHVNHQNRGVGSQFIELAKSAAPGRLHLYTFQRNLKARRFYKKHGFREIAYGYVNMEGLADVELEYLPLDQPR